ncbi:MAG: NAD(P)H-dependent oxidoreductase [Alphaproteobacteria bacterium]|nr:NAD(P)H-dependent oxidoreductase [Alphaproteobacteria bacterium]MBO4643820.1 NAD(P)H-dependent oxidoreductase [Alphaproteobacteria bacterium]
MKKILVVSGHTDLNDSVANKLILETLKKELPQAEFDFLDKLYPDFKIDVKAEQEKLTKADIIVLQFPVFWYSYPSLMHKWFEDVFVFGFSHGTGKALNGKTLLASLTSGAPEEIYRQNFTINDLLAPLKQTAALCGMKQANFVYTGGVSYALRNEPEKRREIEEKAKLHAQRLIDELNGLS